MTGRETEASRLAQIRAIAERVAQSRGLEIFDVQFRTESHGWVLRVFLDKPGTAVVTGKAGSALAEGVTHRRLPACEPRPEHAAGRRGRDRAPLHPRGVVARSRPAAPRRRRLRAVHGVPGEDRADGGRRRHEARGRPPEGAGRRRRGGRGRQDESGGFPWPSSRAPGWMWSSKWQAAAIRFSRPSKPSRKSEASTPRSSSRRSKTPC